MKYRDNPRKQRAEIKLCNRWPGVILILTTSMLFSCSHKSEGVVTPSASPNISPGVAPVAQLSPDTAATAMPKASPDRKVFRTGEAVPAGYLGYKVYASWFTDHLSRAEAGKSVAGSFLYVDLSMVNTDKKERPVGPFTLTDEKGREFTLSAAASTAQQSVGQIERLGPGASKRAFAIFAVPRGRKYKLKIPGFTTADSVQIELSPAAVAPAK